MLVRTNIKYKTVSGLDVRIYAVDGHGDYPVHGAVFVGDGWEFETWTNTGKSYKTGVDNEYDLELFNPYELFKKDDQVFAVNASLDEVKAYFSHWEMINDEFIPYVFPNGRTSWSADIAIRVWHVSREPGINTKGFTKNYLSDGL